MLKLQNINSENKLVAANLDDLDFKRMSLQFIEDPEELAEIIAYQYVNSALSSDEEEKSEIVSEEAIRNINITSNRAPGMSNRMHKSFFGIGPVSSQFKEMKIATSHSSFNYSTDDEAEQP